jgi:hypothetical protein
MCKESMLADICPRCHQRMFYTEQHMLVCTAPMPAPKVKRVKKGDRNGTQPVR